MSEPRYVIIHGHFYQPPRESPWTGLISPEAGAAPFPNWNEQILSECYIANAHAHIMDGPVAHIRNNYAVAQFRLRPDADWLAAAPRQRTLIARSAVATRKASRAHGGHGNAIAQSYNHSILPLLPPRDRELQIAWGIEDFVYASDAGPRVCGCPNAPSIDDTLRDVARGRNEVHHPCARARDVSRRGRRATQRRPVHLAARID